MMQQPKPRHTGASSTVAKAQLNWYRSVIDKEAYSTVELIKK